jgi:hypothetical protein
MPAFTWPFDPLGATRGVERVEQARTYAVWAVWSVDAACYLCDLDNDVFNKVRQLGDFPPDTVDLAHARWAAGTAMTAIDLCGAAIGCLHFTAREKAYDIEELTRPNNRSTLQCGGCREWLEEVGSDDYYQDLLKNVRDRLTHRALRRHLFGTNVPDPDLQALRTKLNVPTPKGDRQIDTGDLVRDARDTAARHVVSFLHSARRQTL